MPSFLSDNMLRSSSAILSPSSTETFLSFLLITELSSDIGDKLKKKEMEMCNQLYKYYGNVYDKI